MTMKDFRNRHSAVNAERHRLLFAVVRIAALGGKAGEIAEDALSEVIIDRIKRREPIPTAIVKAHKTKRRRL